MPDDPLSTQLLVEHAQQGDQIALNELCSRYLQRAFAAVRIRLGAKLRCKVESCDIVQSVMMEAVRGIDRFEFRTEGAFLNYLNKLVENRIRDKADHWAAQKRNPDREVSVDGARSQDAAIPLDIPEDSGALTPSRVLGLKEDLSQLETAMDRLADKSAEYRELIVAVKIEGRSYREIAAETDTTEDAVRMRVKRAMVALANIYRDLAEVA